MVNGILHETGRPRGAFAATLLLFCSVAAQAALASPLFDDDVLLDIELRGPLWEISRHRNDRDRVEHPFVLTVDGTEVPLQVRVRGNSRTAVCRFPPLRFNFSKKEFAGSVFDGQDKLKLVTHCHSNSDVSENNLLDEYTAYRIFNRVSAIGYRVRLLRVRYVDTGQKLRGLDRPYYAFLIESDDELAARVGGRAVQLTGVPYSLLDDGHTARFYVFQYLIGNFDWSFVRADNADSCCHNVDLIGIDEQLLPVPYDFDFSGFVDARYTSIPGSLGIRRATQRVYRGYCGTPGDAIAAALDEIVALRSEIMDVVASSPAIGEKSAASREAFLGDFFEQADTEREELLDEFARDCVGPN